MNRFLKIILCLATLCSGTSALGENSQTTQSSARVESRNNLCKTECASGCYPCGSTTFIPRSQGANTARELVGWQKELYLPFIIPNYGTTAFTFEYSRSFDPSCLASRLLCADCLSFAGSLLPKPFSDQLKPARVNDIDIIADNFGLAQDFMGALKVKPVIENYIVDLECFFGLNDISWGAFFRLHVPIVYTKWDLGLNECLPCANKSTGSPLFPPYYMSDSTNIVQTGPIIPTSCEPTPPYSSISPIVNCDKDTHCVVNRETASSLRQALSGNFLFGDMQTPWEYGKFNFCPNAKTGVADIDVIFGYNLLQSDYGHFALFGQLVVPTGNRPNGEYFFEPIVGNGKHWELGGGLSTHFSLRNDREHGCNMGLYLEGNATYMFKSNQVRSFDFKDNELLSRYMLLKEYDINNFYTGNMINAINFTTRNVDVHVGYKVDISAKLYIQSSGWIFDAGYNIYAKAKETIVLNTNCPCTLDERRFAIKGTSGNYYNNNTVNLISGTIDPTGTQTASNSYQPDATIFVVNNPEAQTISQANIIPCDSTGDTDCAPIGYLTAYLQPDYPATLTKLNINEANFVLDPQPKQPYRYVSCTDLDLNSGAQCRMLTNKFFTHLNYTWYDRCYNPYLGAGGEVEFDASPCNSGLSQWGVWLKGGVVF